MKYHFINSFQIFHLSLFSSLPFSRSLANSPDLRGIALLLIIPFRGIERENGLERVEGKAERERTRTGARKCAGVCRLSPFNRRNVWEISGPVARRQWEGAVVGLCERLSVEGVARSRIQNDERERGGLPGRGRRGCVGGYATAHPRRRPFFLLSLSLPLPRGSSILVYRSTPLPITTPL